ncbi:MAG TPA: adenylosuccinate synthetase [Patescibacteria group bacterium]|nr:adenylosuccinate synthetase [Patescibacteria group bacterium]
MKRADVVIGANFGDEGKGLLTDFLAARAGDAVVIRFNGGAQAGHTVQTPDGKRHVFSHIGAGTFAGAETYLSRFFVCNPLLFRKEHEALARLTPLSRLRVDRAAFVTTPYDMMINQIVEERRGAARHGSCGMGFGETIERCGHAPLLVNAGMLSDAASLRHLLNEIRDKWMPRRLAELGTPDIPEKWLERITSSGIVEKFLDDAAFFAAHVSIVETFPDFAGQQIIFEGAQGLLLDQECGTFPYVTRSHTGLRNAATIAREAEVGALDVTYVTRAYMTRHGAGPMQHELPGPPDSGVSDATNVVNDWQGHLRFGYLDVDSLAARIARDTGTADTSLKLSVRLAVSCLDQIGLHASFVDNGAVTTGRVENYLALLKKKTGVSSLLASHGPTRETLSSPHAMAA